MDTGRWKIGDEFPLLDLVAKLRFKTEASLSFDLSKLVDRHSPRLPEMEPGEESIDGGDKWDFMLQTGPILLGLGWLDVHHPCEGENPLQLRVTLPERYVTSESLQALVPQVVKALGLPADVSYRVILARSLETIFWEEPWCYFMSTAGGNGPGA